MSENPMETAVEAAETAAESNQEDNAAGQDSQNKTWYPYITKTQFEKFISRLQTKVPEQIDRDYIRPIIRTPSMIHRFLRGLEAMRLVDRNQRPTSRLNNLIAEETYKYAVADILKDLYPDLLEQWQQAEGGISDQDIVSFFHSRTGMGNDSANKMKMFFKYLTGEADFSAPPPQAEVETAPPEQQVEEKPSPPQAEEPPAPAAEPKLSQSRKVGGRQRQGGSNGSQNTQSAQGSSSGERAAAAERPERAAERSPERLERAGSNRALTEHQKAYMDTLQKVLNINIDGDWDDDMIKVVFDRLERLFDRVKRQ